MKRSEKNIRPFLLFILVPAIFTFSAPAADSAPAVITDPVPGSVLTSTEVTFTWSDTGAEQYWLWIGSSEGTHDIYSGDQLTNTSKTLSDLSCNGETLYVRLSSKIGTDWISNDYTYTAPVIVAAEMQTPVQDSVLGSADVTFTWNDTGASHYWLWIGSSEGTYDIYSGDQLTNTSCTVSDLLCNGKTLYVRLFSKVCGEWLPNDYTYTAPVVEAAEMQTPVPGSVLGSGGATFTWNDTGVSQYWLWIGSSEGTHDIYSGDQLANTSSTVSELPYNGETLYVRLSSKVCGEWLSNDYTYTAPVIAVAEIHTPVPGSILRSTDTTFTWNDTGASQYWLWVGTSEGGKDIYSGGQGTNTSRKISGLPHNGETLYVRLHSMVNGEWVASDCTYTSPVYTAAVIQSPVPGSVLSSTAVTFTWNDTGAEQYWLWVGTSEGGKDIYSGGQGTNTSRKISGLPHNGETLYVRLNSMVNGEWVASNCTYTSPVYTAAVIQSPVPGSVLSSTAVTFTWNETGAEQYWLWVGTSEGGKDIYSDGQGTNTSRTVFQLPNKGETLYVRLFSKLNGEWPTNSYTYTACDHRPVITVTGPDERTSYEDSTVIAGTAVGVAADLASVTAISDREQEPFPVETDNTGAFSCKIPLAVGPNLLTFIAKDIAGNEGLKHISVAYHLPGAVKTEITSPADGAVVYEEPITVSGTVTSSLDPDQITLMLGDRTGVLSGENGEYTFSFKNVGLAEGSNLLEVVAETEYGKSSASATVHYYSDPDQEAPTIEIHSPLPGTCVATGNVDVKGTARSLQGIESVTVNSSEVPTTPESGTEVFFELKDVEISEGQISVTATDTAGNSSSVTLDVESDSTPPNITLITPSEHTENVFSVTETPYLVTGDVNEKNLAGFSVNSRNIHVLPSATLDTWSFEAGIVLTAREDLPLTLEAWDCAGNRKALEFILKLSASAIIEMISPSEGSEYTASGSQTEIKVTARVSGSPAGSTAEVSADGGTPQIIPMTAGLVNGIFLSPATHDDQILTLRISDTQGATVAQTSVRYKITDPESIPLRVEKTDPANNAENAEPNDVIQFYFNRPVEESELQATVKETAHGLVYDTEKYKNAGIAEMSDISFIEVHRDMETVPGKLSVLTGGYIAHFYPSRDFAYGGRVSAKLTFNGEELFRSVFTVRDLPTFVAGAVSDLYGSAVVGVEVHLPDPGKVAVTDTEGGFSFGFGESSESMLSPGRYQLVINPNLKNRAFGTLEMRINVEQGRLNNTGIIRIPMLDPDEPFRRIRGGTEKALLADGSLEMDFSEAVLAFPDGRSEGDVHVQPQSIDAVPFGTLPGAVPHWMFAVQPQGIEISGSVGIVLKMPRLHGTYDYIPPDMTPVLIVGFDTESEKIVPVGAGRISNGRVLSDVTEAVNDKNKKVNLLSMNYIGYALVQPEQHALLEQYLEGTISLRVLTGKLVQ